MRPVVAGVLAALLAAAGCAQNQQQWRTEQLTPELIQEHGTRTIPVSRSTAMAATAAALRASGYDVAIQNPERGILKTDLKLISTSSRSVGQQGMWQSHTASSRSVAEYMQFVARFSDAPGGGTTIRLEPKRYRGQTDITTSEPFWEGYLEEQWNRIFQDIDDALPSTPDGPAADTI